MIRFPFALLFAFSFVLAAAQVSPERSKQPLFNPDHDANGVIQTLDLMEVLTLFGQSFETDITDDARFDLLFSMLETQHEELLVLRAMIARPESPFYWNEEAGVWIATAPIVVQNTIRAKRLESRTAKLGGLSTN